jgi:hypothetical protein
MNVIEFILLLLGAICFIAAAFGYGTAGGANPPARPLWLEPLGLFFWILVPLIHAAQGLG